MDEPTIALANVRRRERIGNTSTYVDSPWIVQVTARAVLLLEYDLVQQTFVQVGRPWVPQDYESKWTSKEIVAASINPSQIVIALSGGVVALLNTDAVGGIAFLQCVLLQAIFCVTSMC